MANDFLIANINDSLERGSAGESDLRDLFAGFTCPPNPDVERFLSHQAIDFTKRNLSVTYLVSSKVDYELLAYFTLAIKSISVNASKFSNTMRRKIERISEVNEQTGEYILAAYLIAQLGKNFMDGANERITGDQLLQSAINTIKDIRRMVGGTVIFLETDEIPVLIAFYERNGFKRFAVRKSRGAQQQHKLVQLLKVM